jgi:glycosyltransferase involved in cell wall biosynthesis
VQVSLIIPTFNREDLLVQTLACALRQDCDDYEIILVDQTPQHTPETDKFLADNAARIKHIRHSPPSLTKARNEGIRQAQGDVIVFVDDDTSFEPGFLTRHLDAHRNGADVVQGRVMEEGARIADKPIWISSRLKYSGSNTCQTPGKTNTITGCNFSISRKVVETIGDFDERFQGLAVREDSDYGLRAYRAGLVLHFEPKAEVFHHRSSSGGVTGAAKNRFFDASYYDCELLFARKHFSKPVVALYRIRLFLRGAKQIKRLIAHANRETRRAGAG